MFTNGVGLSEIAENRTKMAGDFSQFYFPVRTPCIQRQLLNVSSLTKFNYTKLAMLADLTF